MMLEECKVGPIERLRLKAKYGDLREAYSINEDFTVILLQQEDGISFVTRFSHPDGTQYYKLSDEELVSFHEMITHYLYCRKI
ncbi:hypothetical protein O4H49_06095 [Kiloniella laminariae]|uniref:Uncharacterized protein n=1 Tax=Kiloniella laminariae TaxID=454162 RepID=A0ABT4LGW5_9PROT|nr:hypothetical protein [Kiloniella laminariae]MCZ4280338.1 hypothetical protein [Kiloniella laminariae]